MSPSTGDEPLVEVRLVGLPMELYLRTRDHGADLMREFELLQLSDHAVHDVPGRLVSLAAELTEQFGAFTASADAELSDAEARGAPQIDLVYRVPPAAAEGAQRLEVLLDEADDYCRAGDELLTLAATPETVAFRHWFLREFVAQAGGRPPTPWPDYREGA
ncbi:MAG: hypothetical protein ACYCU7_08460 [Acidimicrobiales bacterium]